uniref:Uncharacterized protein n=1 Tax=Rhizophora mucronata TaxID=61149 RepID=A0A2P2MTF2_RHIMU
MKGYLHAWSKSLWRRKPLVARIRYKSHYCFLFFSYTEPDEWLKCNISNKYYGEKYTATF